jgi:sulfonate transport system substrate-binding protein
MSTISRRTFSIVALAAGLAFGTGQASAQAPKEIRLDFATYNPVSLLIKERGLLEKEFAKDFIAIRWVQSQGSNKALEFLNAGSIDFGSTAGAAALLAKVNGNPLKAVYVFSLPEWTALVTTPKAGIASVADLKGKRVAVTRGTDPHIFLIRALREAKLTERDVRLVLLQHADGRTALERGDVDAWAGLDPLMAISGSRPARRSSTASPRRTRWASSMCARSSPRRTRSSSTASCASTRKAASSRSPSRRPSARCSSPPRSCRRT